jgi:DNA polymerase
MTEGAQEPKKPKHLPVHPDARKSLDQLCAEWRFCEACELGARRVAMEGSFVFGEGIPRGIMFVGEGPGKDEEKSGRPFVGRSGKILRGILEKLEFRDYYISNTVACRSCAPITDGAGNPILSKGYGNRPPEPRYVDQPPTKQEVEACRPRLMEEIYLVDPVVVVALGGGAAAALSDGAITITKARGQAVEILVPGAVAGPHLTGKGLWRRKVKGEVVQPVKQNQVRYLMIPTLHPAFVARRANDFSRDNPFQQLYLDIRQAVMVYNRYQLETGGVVTKEPDDQIPYDVLSEGDE